MQGRGSCACRTSRCSTRSRYLHQRACLLLGEQFLLLVYNSILLVLQISKDGMMHVSQIAKPPELCVQGRVSCACMATH